MWHFAQAVLIVEPRIIHSTAQLWCGGGTIESEQIMRGEGQKMTCNEMSSAGPEPGCSL